jgi:hypothetical protein
MGARVVTLDAGYWASEKPPDYKNNTLDKALSTFQGLEDDAKKTKIPLKMEFESKLTISNFDGSVKSLQDAIKSFESAKDNLKKVIAAATAVQAAATKTAAELIKLSKGKNVDEQKYKIAAASAQQLGGVAADKVKEYQ